MHVVYDRPPLFDEIDAAFHVAGEPILFAWKDRIYNPLRVSIPQELFAHEQVHGDRQRDDVTAWWRRYIAEPEFRLSEEIPAHIAEYKALCMLNRDRWTSERNMRRTFAAHVARKLSAPLYGNLITLSRAKDLILAA